MAELVYSEEALYREAPTTIPHERDGVRMHGGFDDSGAYVPPRSGGRREAMDAWTLRFGSVAAICLRCGCLAADRGTDAEHGAAGAAARERHRPALLERPDHHRQDRGARPGAGRDDVSRPAGDHRRRHLRHGPRSPEQRPAGHARHRRGRRAGERASAAMT